jgi:transposase
MDESPTPTCPNCERFENELAGLKAQLKELQQRLDQKTRSSQRQAAPFRRRKRKTKPKKPGRKAGHPPAFRSRPEQIDRTIEVPLEACPHCGSDIEQKQTVVQYQTEIPPVRPTVTQFNIETGLCRCCQKRVQQPHHEQTSTAAGTANHTVGPRAKAMAADWKYRLGIPFRKISDIFANCFGLQFSPGGICRALQNLATKHGLPLYKALQLQLDGKVVHGDETGWRLGGAGRWLHAFATEDIVLFAVRSSRGSDVPREILGVDFRGTVVCDGWAAYDIFPTARCNAHVLRRVVELLESEVASRAVDLKQIKQLLLDAFRLRDRKPSMTLRGYLRMVTRHKRAFAAWIAGHVSHSDAEVGRLARHLRKYEREFLLFLDRDDIPATNNYAERTIRFAVVIRKRGGCNKTERGARTFEILASILATFQRRGKDFCTWVQQALRLKHPKFIPPDLLPDDFPIAVTYN